jgi:hypothetical protein
MEHLQISAIIRLSAFQQPTTASQRRSAIIFRTGGVLPLG